MSSYLVLKIGGRKVHLSWAEGDSAPTFEEVPLPALPTSDAVYKALPNDAALLVLASDIFHFIKARK